MKINKFSVSHQKTVDSVKNFRKKLKESVTLDTSSMVDKKNVQDVEHSKNEFLDFFKDVDAVVHVGDIDVYDKLIFFGGSFNNIIQFVYIVSSDESINGVQFEYSDNFVPDDEKNKEIIAKVQLYFENVFYPHWKENILES